jgi:hypothetical protein
MKKLFLFLSCFFFLTVQSYAKDNPKPQVSQTNAYDAINNVVNKVSGGIDHVTNVVEKNAPKALEYAVMGVFAKGMATIIIGCILFVVFLISSFFFWKFCSAAIKYWKEYNELAIPFTILSIITCISSGILFLCAIGNIADSDAWFRIISPQGYLAQQILTRVIH